MYPALAKTNTAFFMIDMFPEHFDPYGKLYIKSSNHLLVRCAVTTWSDVIVWRSSGGVDLTVSENVLEFSSYSDIFILRNGQLTNLLGLRGSRR